MTSTLKVLWVLLCLASVSAFAQSNQDKAKEMGQQAVALEDEGKFNEAIKLLEGAQNLDPKSLIYPYELAYSYYSKEDYKKAIEYLEPLTKNKQAYDRVFQLLGNAYDNIGQSDMALEVYDKGLKRFPKAGNLYLETGNVYWVKKDYNKAVGYYEKGIEVNPEFPSNYYRAAKLYCGSDNPVWGMIYGEIFMNLERNSKRTAEMSKLLYDTYLQHINIKNDTAHVSFSKNNVIYLDKSKKDPTLLIPYGTIYELNILEGIPVKQSINLGTLDTIRTNFLTHYYQKGYNKRYPNVLFDYQKKIQDAGYMDIYNHWLLSQGDETEFTKWQLANQSGWNNFMKWYSTNGLQTDENHKFYRAQYQ